MDKGEQPPATVIASFLPDGRYRLQIDRYIPVVISAALFAALTQHQRWAMVRLLAAHAALYCVQHRLPIPWKTGRFVQGGDEFFLEDELDPYGYAEFRVPGRRVIAGA